MASMYPTFSLVDMGNDETIDNALTQRNKLSNPYPTPPSSPQTPSVGLSNEPHEVPHTAPAALLASSSSQQIHEIPRPLTSSENAKEHADASLLCFFARVSDYNARSESSSQDGSPTALTKQTQWNSSDVDDDVVQGARAIAELAQQDRICFLSNHTLASGPSSRDVIPTTFTERTQWIISKVHGDVQAARALEELSHQDYAAQTGSEAETDEEGATHAVHEATFQGFPIRRRVHNAIWNLPARAQSTINDSPQNQDDHQIEFSSHQLKRQKQYTMKPETRARKEAEKKARAEQQKKDAEQQKEDELDRQIKANNAKVVARDRAKRREISEAEKAEKALLPPKKKLSFQECIDSLPGSSSTRNRGATPVSQRAGGRANAFPSLRTEASLLAEERAASKKKKVQRTLKDSPLRHSVSSEENNDDGSNGSHGKERETSSSISPFSLPSAAAQKAKSKPNVSPPNGSTSSSDNSQANNNDGDSTNNHANKTNGKKRAAPSPLEPAKKRTKTTISPPTAPTRTSTRAKKRTSKYQDTTPFHFTPLLSPEPKDKAERVDKEVQRRMREDEAWNSGPAESSARLERGGK